VLFPTPGSTSLAKPTRRTTSTARKKYGLLPARLLVSRTQLDKLEARGYLDPDLRGNRVDEANAIEAAYWFLTVSEQPGIQPSASWIAKSSFDPEQFA
jgi:hypothetical protein